MGKNKKNRTIDDLSDKKVLEAVYALLERATIVPQLIFDERRQMVTHQVVVVACGDKFFASDPIELRRPLIPSEERTLN